MPSTNAAARSAGAALRELAATLAGFSWDSVPEGVGNAARQRLFDTLGAACLGFATPEARAVRALDAELGALGGSRSALDRCRLYAGATRTTEIDDIDVASCTTVGSVVVPAALAFAAAEPRRDDHALLAAVVAGYEAMIRLGRAIGGATLLYRGVWPTYATAAFGSAAAVAKLLGLDADATARALTLALARSSALPAGSLARVGFRYYALGCATADGCVAALAARAGVGAEPDDIASYAECIGAGFAAQELLEGLGAAWRIREVDTKLVPSSRQAIASIEAFTKLVPRPLAPGDVERIVVAVPAAYRDMVDRRGPPATRVESMIGVQYQVALTALEPEAVYDALREPLRNDDRIAALAAKIEVRADPGLTEHFPGRWGSRVTLRRSTGEETTAEVLEPLGSGRGEIGWSMLQRKLERIFAASHLAREAALLAPLRAACESVGAGKSADGAARLLEPLDAALAGSASRAHPAGRS